MLSALRLASGNLNSFNSYELLHIYTFKRQKRLFKVLALTSRTGCRSGLEKTDIDACTRTRLLFALATATANKEEKHKMLEEAVQLKGHLPTVAISMVTQAIEK